ncbi:MAG: type II toxin-antitoxin system Phd/YefM family antitoxin [Myxococcaceae bacterium]
MRTELVTTLKRQATRLLDELERTREPITITQHGLPSAVLVDVETWTALEDKLGLLEGIARGERAIAEGRVMSGPSVRRRLARWLK